MRYDALYPDRTMPAIRKNLLPHFCALKMAVVSYADTSMQFCHTTQCHNPEDTILHSCCSERLKAQNSHKIDHVPHNLAFRSIYNFCIVYLSISEVVCI